MTESHENTHLTTVGHKDRKERQKAEVLIKILTKHAKFLDILQLTELNIKGNPPCFQYARA